MEMDGSAEIEERKKKETKSSNATGQNRPGKGRNDDGSLPETPAHSHTDHLALTANPTEAWLLRMDQP